jgi:hypothetical protein
VSDSLRGRAAALHECDDDGCIKEGEMGEACDNHETDEKYTQRFVLEAGRENLGEDAGDSIEMGLEVVVLAGEDKDPSDTMKGGKFLYCLSFSRRTRLHSFNCTAE